MKIYLGGSAKNSATAALGFTLVETVMAAMLASIMLSALYASFACGFAIIRTSRENLRATEIMLERLERIRVCSFNDVTNSSINPPSLTSYYDPADQSKGGGGIAYTVTYNSSLATNTLPIAYNTNMLLVTVGVKWTSGKVQHNRSMQTYVAREGIWNYVQNGK